MSRNSEILILILSTILLLLLPLSSPNLNAQVTLEWVARYNSQSNGDDYAKAMAIDSVGNVYVTGTDADMPYGFVTLKINSSGQIVWARRYSGGQAIMAQPKSVAVDLKGNVYVGASDVDYIVIKYDSVGVQQWVKRYRGDGFGINELNDLTKDRNSNSTLVTGYGTYSSGFDGCFTIKLSDISGDSIWYRKFTPNPTICAKIDVDIFRNIIVSGVSNVAVLAPSDFLTISYDLNGNLRWAQTFDGPANRWDEAKDVAVDKNGNTYVTGSAILDTLNTRNITTIKYDCNGNQQWIRFYDGSGHYFLADGEFIETDLFGNVIVSGRQVVNSYDYCTIKYDSLGNQLWVRTYTSEGDNWDLIRGLAVDKYGSVYVTGDAVFKNEYPYPYKITIIKYDKDGNQVWLQKYPDVDTISNPAAIIVDNDLNVYIAGRISGPGGYGDIIVLKYSQPTAIIEPKDNEIPGGFELYQNYPNPFNAKTDIRYQISDYRFVTLKVYDVFGREVATLVKEKKGPGEYHVEWNAEGMASGVYIYQLKTKNYMKTMKMLFIK